MVTFPNEWNILEWDDKRQANKQTYVNMQDGYIYMRLKVGYSWNFLYQDFLWICLHCKAWNQKESVVDVHLNKPWFYEVDIFCT